MKATITKIHPNKYSVHGNMFTRIEFKLADGTWAKTDVCPDYRNYKGWQPVLVSGVGTELDNLKMRNKTEINADSSPVILKKPEVKYTQMPLFDGD